jgi:Asp-tRNA(Asn)/Glu-tRNA(Gln) amidotransferase C subunit
LEWHPNPPAAAAAAAAEEETERPRDNATARQRKVELAKRSRSEQPRDQKGRYRGSANALDTTSEEPSPTSTPSSLSASSSNRSSQLFNDSRDLYTPPTLLFIPTVQKTPTPPPVQQQKRRMANTEIIPMFSGDPETAADPNAVTPSTFIKKFRSHMRDLAVASDTDRIDALLNYLVEDSPAEKWYKDLKASVNAPATWAAWQAAFVMRFPGPQKAERTTQEWERELMGMKLKVEELDTTVQVGGASVFAHVNFASKLLETAKLAKIDTTTSSIWQSRNALSEVLCEKVPPTQANWTTYTDAIKAVDCVHIREGVVKAKKAQEVERVVRDLAARDKGRQVHNEPTTPISKMSVQMQQAALNTPKAPANPPGANPFSQGGGSGNLFGQGSATELSEEGLAKLRTIAEKLG